ncbi:MAG: PQQ-like beta-propeller repeat protein [Bacteroidia bacterium]|nr:PQQ-like beta-propeller repeat protein [Bacteroidia bacterium]
MKKKWKIILIIVVIVFAIIIFLAYRAFHMILGSEEISGKLDKIPSTTAEVVPLTKGIADWPCWRGSRLDGKNVTTGINTDWTKGLKKLWQADYLCQGKQTATWSSPVVQGNRLVVPGRDEKNDLVFCINSETGKLIWAGSYPADAEIGHGPGSRATACIDSICVYTFGRSGDLACWSLENGKLIWKKNVKDIGGQEPRWGFASSPLVYKNMVIVKGGGKALVVAYNKINGDVLWKSMEGDAGYSASTLVSIDNDLKLLAYHAKGLSCLEPENGKELWRIPWETDHGINATTPLVDKDIIFHTAGYNMGGQAIKARKDGYSVLWKNNAIASHHSDPILIDGFLYGYSGQSTQNKGFFKCVEFASGKEMWSSGEIGWGTTTFADGYLLCLDIKGNLYLVRPDPAKFIKVGEIKSALENVKNQAWTVPVMANGKLYLRYLQTLVCYNLMP